jgi:TetR/AcrR family transcriptional repressor of nem operon
MRYPESHKETVRARIIEAASRALRAEGLDGVSIPKLMKLVGLSHGGFYVHFRDRDELVAEALMAAGQERAEQMVAEGAKPREERFRNYLSTRHVDHPEAGCVLATLGTEAPRQPPAVRRAFARIGRGFLRRIETVLHPKSEPDALSDEALETAARIVGAVVLARLVQDDGLAERILEAAHRRSTRR